MILTDSHYLQLIGALCAGLSFFVAIYLLPSRFTYAAFAILIPFQLIDSRFGSLNTVLAYMWFIAFVLLGRLRYLPLIGPLSLLMFVYAMAFALAPVPTMLDHSVYMFSFLTNFLLFYLAYNVIREKPDWTYFRNVIIVCNVLVILYCAAQLIAPDRFAIAGISEFSLSRTRTNRLTGPFNATAATADYLVIVSILLFYSYLVERKAHIRVGLLGLFGVNTTFLLTTGNRGGFLIYVIGITGFLWGFRKELGGARIVRLVLVGAFCLTLASAFVINATRFNVVYERLSNTTFESGVIPDTRVGTWEDSWAAILESPIKGHGPMLRLGAAGTRVEGIPQIQFPHSLPIYILYTTGLVGLIAYTIFFVALFRRLARSVTLPPAFADDKLAGIPRLNLLLFALFAISQLRIEMLREGLFDFAQFVFVLFGSLLGFSDALASSERSIANQSGIDERTEPEFDVIPESPTELPSSG